MKKLLADVHRGMTHLRQKCPLPVQPDIQLACCAAWTKRRMVSRETWFLRSLGEKAAADWWEALDLTRQAGWYGGEPDPADAHKALTLLEQIRLWATQ